MSADQSASQTSIRELRARRSARARDLELRRRIGELVSDLMRDILGLVVSGSAAEIGELLENPGPRRAESAEGRVAFSGGGAPRGGRRSSMRAGGPSQRMEPERRPSIAPHSPFDITSPGELLASPDDILSRVEQALPKPAEVAPPAPAAAEPETAVSAAGSPAVTPEPETAAPTRASGLLDAPAPTRRRAASPPAPSAEAEAEAESERRPRIVLREGEQLVSATGSGVVIRRARVQNR